MAPITASTEIARPAADVFSYATDPSRFSEWQKGVVSGHAEGASTSAVGTRWVTVRRIGFTERPSTIEVEHLDAPRSWRARGVDGPIRAVVDVTVEPRAEDRAGLTITIDFVGHGIGRLLVPLAVRREACKEMPANLATLKRRLEDRR